MGERFGQVVLGPGDDCAVVRGRSGELLLATTDQIVSGRHFRPGTPVDRIARKLVARSVSDIAAMGGSATWALATGALPSDYDKGNELFESMARWGDRFGCPLVGGDISTLDGGGSGAKSGGKSHMTVGGQRMGPSFIGRMVLTCTVVGSPHPERGPVLRSTACAGDEVWVTGRLGGSLHSGRHLAFTPRVREGAALCDDLGPDLHAMIDLSDGLGRDSGRIGLASGVRIELEEALLPMHEDVHDWRAAVADGEDYELCFTVAARSLGLNGEATCRVTGTRMRRVGRVVSADDGGCGSVLIDRGGRRIDVSVAGWDHGEVEPGAS